MDQKYQLSLELRHKGENKYHTVLNKHNKKTTRTVRCHVMVTIRVLTMKQEEWKDFVCALLAARIICLITTVVVLGNSSA